MLCYTEGLVVRSPKRQKKSKSRSSHKLLPTPRPVTTYNTYIYACPAFFAYCNTSVPHLITREIHIDSTSMHPPAGADLRAFQVFSPKQRGHNTPHRC